MGSDTIHWIQGTAVGLLVFAALGTAAAQPLEPILSQAFPTQAPVAEQDHPGIATNGENILVAWESDNGIAVGRISQEGSLLDGTGVLISDDGQNPAVGSNGEDYLVVYQRLESNWNVYGRRVSGEGLPIGAEFAIATTAFHKWELRVAGTADYYMVVWEVLANLQLQGGVNGCVIDALTGTKSWCDFNLSGLTAGDRADESPDVASDGTEFFVVWARDIPFTTDRGLYGVSVDPVLASLGTPTKLLSTTIAPSRAAVGHSDSTYLAVLVGDKQSSTGVIGVRVDADSLSNLDPTGFLIGDTWNIPQEAELNPRVAGSESGFLVSWQDKVPGTTRMTKVHLDGFSENPWRVTVPGLSDAADLTALPGDRFAMAYVVPEPGSREVLVRLACGAGGESNDGGVVEACNGLDFRSESDGGPNDGGVSDGGLTNDGGTNDGGVPDGGLIGDGGTIGSGSAGSCAVGPGGDFKNPILFNAYTLACLVLWRRRQQVGIRGR